MNLGNVEANVDANIAEVRPYAPVWLTNELSKKLKKQNRETVFARNSYSITSPRTAKSTLSKLRS